MKSLNVQQIISIIGLSAVIAVSSPVSMAFAQVSVSPTGTQKGNQTQRLSDVIAKGDQAISERLTSLNTLLTKVQGMKKLKPADQTQFVNNINSDISGLNALKVKLDADTDVTTARTDFKNIFLIYRVYAVFIPSTAELAAVDTMTTTADLLDAYANALATRIQQKQSQGKDVSSLLTTLADMRSQIVTARSQYATVESTVAPLTPNSFNTDPTGTKTILVTGQTDIKIGATALKTAWNDAKTIRQGLQALGGSTSPTPGS